MAVREGIVRHKPAKISGWRMLRRKFATLVDYWPEGGAQRQAGDTRGMGIARGYAAHDRVCRANGEREAAAALRIESFRIVEK